MSRWRIAVLVGLMLVPVLIWIGVGTYYLWISGWGFYVWWITMACMATGYWLTWHWQRNRQLLPPPDFELLHHRTLRDEEAWTLVKKRIEEAVKIPHDKLGEPSYYRETAEIMAQELAAFYYPGADDPVGNLCVPEILAVIELVAHDLAEMVEQHLPGGHLLTVNDWKRAHKWTQLSTNAYSVGRNIYYLISALFNPLQIPAMGMQYAASHLGTSSPWRMLQQNLFLEFYTAYVHRIGTYLIELNSGRLRVGASRYRQLLEESKKTATQDVAVAEKIAAGPFLNNGDAIDRVNQITVALVGQVKAGKSSLINALLGEERARTAVVPMTGGVERYELLTPGIPTRLVLLDTAGYHQTGASADQVATTAEIARGADLVLLVMHARNPARQADLDLLNQLQSWFAAKPDSKAPPMIGVLTHIDLLSPSLEWKPPYNWRKPSRPKEEHIQGAIATVQSQLGDRLACVVPICTQPGKQYGIEEELMPAVAQLLDEVHGVALLRCLRAEADRDRVRRVFHQMLATGKVAAQIAWEGLKKM